ncbi:YueI family protein [Lactobacillus bombicola]|uniref:DUF1694 domain-containing protein n=1 Tax=Lactobacillus bombicola TaxID=1505723 RepID=A0A396SSA2_9LACO|nr:YueI family protein [Lactobacillus bombicola]RHW50405.1 DUF1694 domain-containing protein [Lactobacillus bombicola]RHW53081.1 DUF1694 domain-containing protein [Lactobacillus bombicola]RHW54516.1 DUF1694 domain-containing protein [Lactobacillus bombicola]
MSEDLNTRVANAAQGISPQTLPDERRRFLGSLRERVLVRMTNAETQDISLTELFLSHFKDYIGYEILLNVNLKDEFLSKIETNCSKYKITFTLINNETAQTNPDDTAVLVVAKTAINKMRIEIKQVYAPEMEKVALPQNKTKQKKISFWRHFFNGDK